MLYEDALVNLVLQLIVYSSECKIQVAGEHVEGLLQYWCVN
jgi:hypothetical protein